VWRRVGEFGFGVEALGAHLVRCLAIQHARAPSFVRGVEAAQHLFHSAMEFDVDAEHLAADAAIEALEHAVGLGRAWPDVVVLRAQFVAGLGESSGKEAAVGGRHFGEAERKGGCGLAQKGDGALLGLVVLEREVDGAQAAVESDEQVSLAPRAVGSLQLGELLDVDVHEAEVVVTEGAVALGEFAGGGLWPAVQVLCLEDALDAVAVEVRQEVADDEGEVVEREVSGASQGADDGALLFGCLPVQLMGAGGAVEEPAAPRLRHLRTVSALL